MTFHYDELLTPGEVAEALRVDTKTVSRWARAGRIPHIRTPGGHARIPHAVLDLLLNGKCPFCGSSEGPGHCDG